MELNDRPYKIQEQQGKGLHQSIGYTMKIMLSTFSGICYQENVIHTISIFQNKNQLKKINKSKSKASRNKYLFMFLEGYTGSYNYHI